jgi:hypothetical protein
MIAPKLAFVSVVVLVAYTLFGLHVVSLWDSFSES